MVGSSVRLGNIQESRRKNKDKTNRSNVFKNKMNATGMLSRTSNKDIAVLGVPTRQSQETQ